MISQKTWCSLVRLETTLWSSSDPQRLKWLTHQLFLVWGVWIWIWGDIQDVPRCESHSWGRTEKPESWRQRRTEQWWIHPSLRSINFKTLRLMQEGGGVCSGHKGWPIRAERVGTPITSDLTPKSENMQKKHTLCWLFQGNEWNRPYFC